MTTAGAAYPATVIDTSNADYDLVTVGTDLGAVTTGDILAEANSTHASTAVLEAAANGLSYHDIYVEDDAIGYSTSGVYAGRIYDRRIRKIDAVEKATLTQIVFSESK